MKKNFNDISRFKIFIKRLAKFCVYFILFCCAIYFITWVIADWIIESHKLDIDDVMSLDRFESISKE